MARDAVVVVLFTLLFLVVSDVVANLLFPPPPVGGMRNAMQRRLEAGRSVEGKLARMVAENDESSAPMAAAGWFGSRRDQPAFAEHEEGLLVAVYGLSSAFRVGRAMRKDDPTLTIRLIGGPWAPLSHSYDCYLKDRELHEADVVILGISAQALAGLESMTQMLLHFDVPAPYTYPLYDLRDGELVAHEPIVQSLDDLRQAMDDTDRWEAFRRQLAEHDRYYDPFVLGGSPLDRSVLVRLIRRGWGQRHRRIELNRVHDATGFNPDTRVRAVTRAIIKSFAEDARRNGRLPIVILFHEKGFADHLYAMVRPTLEQHRIPFVSTHELAPASDYGNYVVDGHFTDEIDRVIARELRAIIAEELGSVRQRVAAN